MKVPLPSDEEERLANLLSYELLDSSEDPFWDSLSVVAAELCGTPYAAVSLIDRERQWFKSRVGLEASETPRDDAFCAHTILQDEPLMVYDARIDERFAENPLVTGQPLIRFYAGAQIVSPEGFHLGALCVIDSEPRELTPSKVKALQALANQITEYLKLRSENRRYRLKYSI